MGRESERELLVLCCYDVVRVLQVRQLMCGPATAGKALRTERKPTTSRYVMAYSCNPYGESLLQL